jgi:DNA-binding beta-propeller fold protein YncE
MSPILMRPISTRSPRSLRLPRSFRFIDLPLIVALALLPLSAGKAANAPTPGKSVREKPGRCDKPGATTLLRDGYMLQADGNSEDALKTYQACVKADPNCADCWYEMGWSYWKLGDWSEVLRVWKQTLILDPLHPEVPRFLPTAKANQLAIEQKVFRKDLARGVELQSQSSPPDAPVKLTYVSRWQSYNKNAEDPLDRFDLNIDSPKSVNFSPDSKVVMVNSLEGAKTVVFNASGTEKLGVVAHRFSGRSPDLNLFSSIPPFDYKFPLQPKKLQQFVGKPVEGQFTHGGKYFWVPYYRRSWDQMSQWPSAMAVIDVSTRRIRRVFHTGPIGKYVRVSPDGRKLAVSHWGDNTVGIWNIEGDEPSSWKEERLLIVERRLAGKEMQGDRDKNCGYCIRGLAFTPDSRFLMVGRMRKGGLSFFDLTRPDQREILTVDGLAPGPRDLHVSHDGKYLYISCNLTGYVWRVPLNSLMKLVHQQAQRSPAEKASAPRHIEIEAKDVGASKAFVGLGVRSIKLSPHDDYVFAAVNQTSEVVVVRTKDMTLVSRITVDSYPVGLDLSPDGAQLWVTAQGREAKGGNSVGILEVRYAYADVIKKTDIRSAEPKAP